MKILTSKSKRKPISAKREREWRGRFLKRYLGIDQRKRSERRAWLIKSFGEEYAVWRDSPALWESYQ